MLQLQLCRDSTGPTDHAVVQVSPQTENERKRQEGERRLAPRNIRIHMPSGGLSKTHG